MTTPSAVTEIIGLWTAARHAIAVVERELDSRLTETLGIPFTTYAVLCTIAEFEIAASELSQQHIAVALGIDKSNVSRHIEAAVASGHVTSAPSAVSRRSKSVSLTASGREALAAAERLVAEFATGLDLRGAVSATRFLTAIGDAVER